MPSDRAAWRWVLIALALYTISFALFYPEVATNIDEAEYIRQTRLLLSGESSIRQIDPYSGQVEDVWLSTYPLGTALSMAPFVQLAGWRGAFIVPWISLLGAVFLTALWLREDGRSPLFALLLLGFPPALVLGRVAMSDVPSAAVVAGGLWLFWRGIGRSGAWWLLAGFVAGASSLYRPTNVLPFVPLFTGTVLRRERAAVYLVVGGIAGVAVRVAASWIYFGDPLYARANYAFAPETLNDRLPLFLLGLLVLVPGGLPLGLCYRGPRRPELLATIVAFFLFFVLQHYSTMTTSFEKRVILALRYFLPLVPVLAFAMAEAVPRLWRHALERLPPGRAGTLRAAGAGFVWIWLLGVCAASAAVHPVFKSWSATQAEIRQALQDHTDPQAVLVTNWPGTRKFLQEFGRRYQSVDRRYSDPAHLTRLAECYGTLYIAFLDRSDSAFWREDREHNAAFMQAVQLPHELLFDRALSTTDHLRIWKAELPGSHPQPSSGSAVCIETPDTGEGAPNRPHQPAQGEGLR